MTRTISAASFLRAVVDDLLDGSATAWAGGAPRLAERLFDAALVLAETDGFEFEESDR